MKKHSVKILSLVLALIMTLSFCPLEAFAAGNQWGWGNWWDQAEGPEMPAQQLKAHDDETGVSVTVDAPEGALPQGTTLSLKSVNLSAVQSIVDNDANTGGTVVAAEDITFYYDGTEIEPEKNVSVTLASDAISNTVNPTVLHLDCSAEEIESGSVPVEIMGSGNSFSSKDFSVYAVVEDNQPSEYARLNVRFFHHDTDTTPFYSVYVTKRDVNIVANIIDDPEEPAIAETEIFGGWSVGKDYTYEDVDGQHTIDAVREQVKTYLQTHDVHEGDTFDVYAMVFKYFNVSYVDENGETTLDSQVYFSKDDTYNYTVFQQYAPYEQGFRFIGWQKDDGDDTIYQNNQSVTLTQTSTIFRAQVQKGYWLSFVENPTTSDNRYKGATYNPPVFCPDGNIPANARPTNPTLSGYVFGGWYENFTAGSGSTPDAWTNQFNFSGKLEQDTTVYAKWTLQDTVPYTVILWRQSINDDKDAADSAKTYDYAFSTTLYAAPNTAISSLDLSYYKTLHAKTSGGKEYYINTAANGSGSWYTFNGFKFGHGPVSSNSSVTTVLPNGTTVINLYWDRQLVTLNFYTKDSYSTTTTWPSNNTIYTKDSAGNYAEVYRYSFKNSNNQTVYRYGYKIASLDMLVHDDGVNDTYDNTHYFFRTSNYTYWVWWNGTEWVNARAADGTIYTDTASMFSQYTFYYWINDVTGNSTTLPTNATFYTKSSSSSFTLRDSYTGLYQQPLKKYGYSWPTDYRWFMNTSLTGSFLSITDTFLSWNSSSGWTTNFYGGTQASGAFIYHYLQNDDESYPEAPDYSVPTGTSNDMAFRTFTGFTASEYRVKLPSGVTSYYRTDDYTITGQDEQGDSLVSVGSWGSAITAQAVTTSNGTEYWTDWIPDGTLVKYGDFEPEDTGHLQPLGGLIEYRYARDQYRITYMVGGYFDGNNNPIDGPMNGRLKRSDAIYYEASIDSYKKGGDDYYDPIAAGTFTDDSFIFEDWYVDPGCTTKYDFTGKTMPLNGVTVYAKFRQREYRVFLEPNLPNDPGNFEVKWGSTNQAMNFRIAYEGLISSGRPIEASDKKGNYILVGWYKDADCTEPFNFSQKLTDDIAVAYDKTTDMTDNVGTSSAYNADVNRDWITKKVVIYAKWRKVLPGANGITVVYDAIELPNTTGKTGTFAQETGAPTTYTDPLRYMDTATALIRTGSTPDVVMEDGEPADTQYQFLYWVVMKPVKDSEGNQLFNEDGTPKLEETSIKYYPGQTFDIDAQYAVVEDVNNSVNPTIHMSPVYGERGTQSVSQNPVRATTDKYEKVTSFVAGGKYVITYGNNVMKNTHYSSSFGVPNAESVTITQGSDGYYTFSSDVAAYQLTASTNGSGWAFENEGGYLGIYTYSSSPYLAFLTGAAYWTPAVTGNTVRLSSNWNTSYTEYMRYDSSYPGFDVTSNSDSQYVTLTVYKLVEDATAEKHTLTINYVYADGTTAATSYTAQVAEGAAYSVTSPTINGYAPSQEVVSGVMGTSDVTVTVTYNEVGHYEWQPTDTIVPNEPYLIGFKVNGEVYLIMNKNPNGPSSNFYYLGDNYSGYTAKATIEDNKVVGCTGWTTDLQYCEWLFSTTQGGIISSNLEGENNYHLTAYSGSDLDLRPATGTTSSYYYSNWKYEDHKLTHDYTGGTKYAKYTPTVTYYSTTYNNFCNATTSYDSTNGYVQLYNRVWVEPVTTNYCTVTFIDDHTGEQIGDPVPVEEGMTVTPPAAPNHEREFYFFTGWNVPFNNETGNGWVVTEDMEIKALYEYRKEGWYLVTFKDWNGAILQVNGQDTQEVEEGHAATAPADPTRAGYTFTGWDKDFSSVTKNLVVYANYSKTVSKSYTVTLRAVYGPKVKNEKTHITWHANNGTGDYANSAEVLMNENISIPTPANFTPTGTANTESVVVTRGAGEETLVWEDHVFMGWARLNIGTGSVLPEYDPTNAAYVKQWDLTEDDLFLKWVPEAVVDGNTVPAHYEAKSTSTANAGTWVSAKYVAADELTPYHAMYAVWAKVFYVYHSGTGKVERIVIDNTTYEKNADGTYVTDTNGNKVPTKNTFDLTSLVSPGFLYGGYYKDYAGKGTMTVKDENEQDVTIAFDAKQVANWTPVTMQEDAEHHSYNPLLTDVRLVDPAASNADLDKLVTSGRISQATDPADDPNNPNDNGAILYNYDNLSKDLKKLVAGGKMTEDEAAAFEARLTWDYWKDSYNADTTDKDGNTKAADRPGNAIIPEAGKTYYIKEVPASMYLLHYTHYTYKIGDTDGVTDKITKMWMISDIDDGNYQGAGFVYFDDNHKAQVVTTLTIKTTGSTPKDPDELSAVSLFGENSEFGRDKGVTRGYLTYSAIDGNKLAGHDSIIDIQNFWITPDNMMVTGEKTRTLMEITSAKTIKSGTLDADNAFIAPYDPGN